MSIPAVPLRTKMYDDKGVMARTWVLFFQSLGSGAVQAASGGPVTVVENIGNTFTPDLSKGSLILSVLLVADSVLNAPTNGFSGQKWTLIVDEDSTGGHNLVLDPTYFYSANLLGTAAANTRSQSVWILDGSGNNSLSGTPSTDQPIPTA